MWTACCNWFCLNGPPEDLPHCPPAGTRAYANAGYSSFPSPTGLEQSCRACRARLQTSSLKCICLDCKNHFCPACSHQPEGGPCLCHLCQRLRTTGFCREELLKVKVKDLRDYLELREVSTATCREKEELVGLILGQQPPAAPPGDWTTLVPPATPVPDNQEQRLPVPASPDRPPGQPSSAQPASQPEGERQANGHVLPSQDMEDVENAGENVTEEETQSVDLEDHLVAGRRASLSDLTSVGDIGALSVRQLKEILARNFVNYKGCCEKWELMERVTRLYKEKDLQQLVSGTDNQAAPSGHAALPGLEDNLCKVCMDSVIDCVLLECGHMVTCTKCGKRMNECPICRQYVVRAVHVFRT